MHYFVLDNAQQDGALHVVASYMKLDIFRCASLCDKRTLCDKRLLTNVRPEIRNASGKQQATG